MKPSLSLLDSKVQWVDDDLQAKLNRVFSTVGFDDRTVNIILINDSYIKDINKKFRGKDKETDVISFSYLQEEPFQKEDDVSGEIYISYETLTREAKRREVDIGHLFLRTAVHGLLHVIGYDHVSSAEAGKMETEEKKILSQLLEKEIINGLFL